ncbi:MAG: hypothetical protein AAF899_14435, partial [Pseudomonadota bacterium]
MIRADVARRVGGFDTRLPCNNDWEYMIRLSTVAPIYHLPKPVVVAYISNDSIHRRMRSKALSFLIILRKHADLFSKDRKAHAARLFTAGRYLFKLGKKRAAILCMLRAVRLAPRMPKPWLGIVHTQLSRIIGWGSPRRGAL